MGMICCKSCGRMANGVLDTCPFCNNPLEVASLIPSAVGGDRMTEAQLGTGPISLPKPAKHRFPKQGKVVDFQEWIAGRRKL